MTYYLGLQVAFWALVAFAFAHARSSEHGPRMEESVDVSVRAVFVVATLQAITAIALYATQAA